MTGRARGVHAGCNPAAFGHWWFDSIRPDFYFSRNPTDRASVPLNCWFLFQMYLAVGMAMMVHPNCWVGCCHPPMHGSVRQREKRATAAWEDEHGDPNDWHIRYACPVDGLSCICNNFSCDENESGPWWRTPLNL
ncbi:hypothetical protein [Nocardia sp. NPDC051833]|uniref:hypothetical protein n=1 Tax=Nocardia sp. NPDC051833 TaxID=3155674 RepID=UPI00343E2525